VKFITGQRSSEFSYWTEVKRIQLLDRSPVNFITGQRSSEFSYWTELMQLVIRQNANGRKRLK
jgi:hypothetical protein